MKKYGIIGFPLQHSFSRTYFTEKFKNSNLFECSYFNFEIEKIQLFPELIKNNPQLLGLNVTIPYKESILSFIDELDVSASEVGAVNVIKIIREDDNVFLIGYNTDVYGFTQSLKPNLHSEIHHAIILGTGGAAKAAAAGLRHLGIDYLFVSRGESNFEKDIVNYAELTSKIISNSLLIINASPLGMFPKINNCPEIDYTLLTQKHILFDLIYNPEQTLFLKKGQEHGTKTINGMKMLILQAEKTWEIFNR